MVGVVVAALVVVVVVIVDVVGSWLLMGLDVKQLLFVCDLLQHPIRSTYIVTVKAGQD